MLSDYVDKEVPFYDVDSYRIAWHGCYPKYFEEARCALLEKIGYSYRHMEESRYFFPITDLRIRYVKPLVFKQKVRVLASLKEWRHKLVIDYLITDLTSGDRLTSGSTTQVAVLMPEQIMQLESPAALVQKVQVLIGSEKDSG
ncbi:MAG: acyl-CoA thioesterase [Gammaproteobacteria bacterium]|nr:acyl-CoA thioesterase [Gammaproteobacteria bacterium]